MAARKQLWHPDEVKQKIRAGSLIQKLDAFAHGDPEPFGPNAGQGKCEMSVTQVTAAFGLLRKVLPDLSSVEATGPDGGALVINVLRLSEQKAEDGS